MGLCLALCLFRQLQSRTSKDQDEEEQSSRLHTSVRAGDVLLAHSCGKLMLFLAVCKAWGRWCCFPSIDPPHPLSTLCHRLARLWPIAGNHEVCCLSFNLQQTWLTPANSYESVFAGCCDGWQLSFDIGCRNSVTSCQCMQGKDLGNQNTFVLNSGPDAIDGRWYVNHSAIFEWLVHILANDDDLVPNPCGTLT